jgi:hypothetical protein
MEVNARSTIVSEKLTVIHLVLKFVDSLNLKVQYKVLKIPEQD